MKADFEVMLKETKSKPEKDLESELENLTRKYINEEINLEAFRNETSKLVARFNLEKAATALKPILFIENFDVDVAVREAALRIGGTQERIEGKIDSLIDKVATRDDLVEQTNQLLKFQQQVNESLQKKIDTLQEMQEANVPHRILFRYAMVFLIFFSFSFLSNLFFSVTIVTDYWNNLGLLISFGFLIMAAGMKIDWQKITTNTKQTKQ